MDVSTKDDQAEEHIRDGLLTKQELAERLRLSTRSVDAWMRSKHLPYLKLGKTVRFRWADVLEKLNTYRVN